MPAASQPLQLCKYHKNFNLHVRGDCVDIDQTYPCHILSETALCVILQNLSQTDDTIHDKAF